MSDMVAPLPLDQQVGANSINAGPLPAEQNFTFLKQEGIKHIKAIAGHGWSNYNDSDPGVTILEQLCYALTELGYVNSFPIEDVLTQANHQIDYARQFFPAEQILTTGPITEEDYRRLVLDRIPDVDNLYLSAVMQQQQPTGLYQVAIIANSDPGGGDPAARQLARRVHDLLNSQRNIGEYFLPPTLLKEQPVVINGRLLLSPEADAQQIYTRIDRALADYVSPLAQQSGYGQLREQGIEPDAIFNGPMMENGWMAGNSASAGKRNTIQLIDIVVLIGGIPGVLAVEQGQYSHQPGVTSLTIAADCIARLRFVPQIANPQGNAAAPPDNITALNALAQLHARHQASSVDASVDLAPPLPSGRYRDIERYYSIQNTFPDIYAVGPNSLQADTPDYRVAQARQLKGYLLMFDQVIANQFSQLANLGNLFSFSFTRTPTLRPDNASPPSAKPDPLAGLPAEPAIRTFFCQPLYDVPDVQALLQGESRYQYFYPGDPDDPRLRAELVWQRFQRDPFNAYHYGLVQAMENTEDAEQRRDAMLSHLLARHGEPADAYNDIIDGLQWFGGRLKSRIFVKSIWLQNLQALSYRRAQACDFTRAQSLPSPGRYRLGDADYRQWLNQCPASVSALLTSVYQRSFDHRDALIHYLDSVPASPDDSDPASGAIWRQRLLDGVLRQDGNQRVIAASRDDERLLRHDGQWDLPALERQARLPSQAYADVSVFELKCALLLGLPRHLRMLAATLARLLQDRLFLAWLPSPAPGTYVPSADDDHVTGDVSVRKSSSGLAVLIGAQPVLNLPSEAEGMRADGVQQYVDQLVWLSQSRQGALLVEHTLLRPEAGAPAGTDDTALTPPGGWLGATLALPDYVALTGQPALLNGLALMQQLHWPAHIGLRVARGNYPQMAALIDAYRVWFNQQRQLSQAQSANAEPAATSSAQSALMAALQALGREDA
ncbi:hypothetical protein MJO48_10760 [Dickeya fangzhongdai]|uniref:hypothetical protein n=1 Tax=Dickeya fangzhongdai TaxID=1778540 RepID=UPI001EFAC814|nr:hypothetical protein [Dickeya fangzhongdai]ULR33110.1 hypothetical protein MJO48_10760 [Dickeya fangzhongdai]